VFRENGREGPARIAPFVDDLFKNAGVGVLRDETCPEHFDAFARDLFDDRWIVHEPPAAERHQVAEFSRQNTEFMLILAAEHAYKKTIRGKIAAKTFKAAQIRSADRVAP